MPRTSKRFKYVQSKKSKVVGKMMREVFSDVPRNVEASGKTGAAKRKMMVAIALSKARAAGANVPKK